MITTDPTQSATLLYHAARNGYTDAIAVIINFANRTNLPIDLEDGLFIEKQGREISPLYIACENGHEETAKKLILVGADINAINFTGTNMPKTALISASNSNDSSIVKLLLSELNKNPNYSANFKSSRQRNALMLSLAKNNLEAASELIKFVDIDAKDMDRKTALHFAIEKNIDTKFVKRMLKEYNANPNSLDLYGNTPLSM